MIPFQIEARMYEAADVGDGKGRSVDSIFPLRARLRFGNSSSRTALVASSDENVLQALAGISLQCGLGTFLAFTIRDARRILERQSVWVVVCDESLIDGQYEDVVSETVSLRLKTPVIVVSPTGDWPDYLKAISAGAFDYLAYPPIPGDLARTIRCALASRTGSILQDTATNFFVF
jgi:DNA-binding NtrC family response regulator